MNHSKYSIYCYTIIVLFLVAHTALAEEFLYPVASFGKGNEQRVYLLYQKSLKHIELWLWNSATKEVAKGLLSTFTPAGLKILPSEDGFSFIDNGKIKIKLFNKRSPKSLDIYEPIYDIGIIEWIAPFDKINEGNNCCYFSAKEYDYYSIFQVNMRGELDRIAPGVGQSGLIKTCDCMYPQKVGSDLFHIQRIRYYFKYENAYHYYYQIVQCPYPNITYDQDNNFNNTEHFDERVEKLLSSDFEQDKTAYIKEEEKKVILYFGKQPIIFLQMTSSNEGYVIEHEVIIDKQDKMITCTYHQIKKGIDAWTSCPLFSFSLPAHLLVVDGPSRLYESILPLLPRHIGNYIYYVDCSKSGDNLNLNVFNYSLTTGVSIQQSFGKQINQYFFAPIAVEDKIFYGGSLLEDTMADENLLPGMWINDEGNLCFDLPSINNSEQI